MKKKVILLSLFVSVALAIIISSVLPNPEPEKENQACIKDRCFGVEIADTPGKRSWGLMYRENLAKDKGMLFIFETEGNYPFWMKNTLIPLDIIWINTESEIVFIAENAQPCKEDLCPNIDPKANTKYVLEINGGFSKEYGFKVGDEINLKIDNATDNSTHRYGCFLCSN